MWQDTRIILIRKLKSSFTFNLVPADRGTSIVIHEIQQATTSQQNNAIHYNRQQNYMCLFLIVACVCTIQLSLQFVSNPKRYVGSRSCSTGTMCNSKYQNEGNIYVYKDPQWMNFQQQPLHFHKKLRKKKEIKTNLEAVYTTVTSIFLFAWDHMKNRIKLSWLSFDSVPAHTN